MVRRCLLVALVSATLCCHKPLPMPEPVLLVSPPAGSLLRSSSMQLQWNPTDAARYVIQVSSDSRFRQFGVSETLQDVTFNLVTQLDGTYHWRVRAQSQDSVWGDWSEAWSFTLERFRLVASVKTQGYPHDVFVHGSRAYVADGQAGLAVFDIATPESPVLLGAKMDSLNVSWGITADDSHAFMAYGYKELLIYDIRRPDSIFTTGVLEYLQPGYGYDIALQDSFVYVAAQAQFVKIKVANRAAPELVYQTYYPRDCRGVAVENDKAYLACEQLGVAVWDNGANPPRQIGSMDTPGNSRGIAVAGGYAFVADGREGLAILDVSDPAHLRESSRIPLDGYANSVAIRDSLAFVACGDGGFSIVDVGQSDMPVLVARIATPHAMGVHAAGRYLYGGDRDLGLVVIRQED